MVNDVNQDNKICISYIFDTLVQNNTHLSYNKFKSHIKQSIGLFVNIDSKETIRKSLRKHIQY